MPSGQEQRALLLLALTLRPLLLAVERIWSPLWSTPCSGANAGPALYTLAWGQRHVIVIQCRVYSLSNQAILAAM